MGHWYDATEKRDLPHCQTSKVAQFEGFLTMYQLLSLKDQVRTQLYEATPLTVPTT